MSEKISIVFMGTPGFAVATLKAIVESGHHVAGVVTAPDRPSGRGLKVAASPVKEYALEKGLTVLQPTNLKAEEFQTELDMLGANLYIVVAFRMLPKSVWNKPALGTFNLHASLLPDYRGAAPINRAIMNGEKESGVTTFFIDEKIDTGKIIDQRKVIINDNDTAGTLHDKLMTIGAELVVTTIDKIKNGNYHLIEQSNISNESLKDAPKLFKDDCKIDWSRPASEVYNKIRGLSPYPGAWSELIHEKNRQTVAFKVFQCKIADHQSTSNYGELITDNKGYLKITTGNNEAIEIEDIQLAGKRKMKTDELLRGFNLAEFIINH